jgi:hypothetical protein
MSKISPGSLARSAVFAAVEHLYHAISIEVPYHCCKTHRGVGRAAIIESPCLSPPLSESIGTSRGDSLVALETIVRFGEVAWLSAGNGEC